MKMLKTKYYSYLVEETIDFFKYKTRTMMNDKMDNRNGLALHRSKIPDEKLLMGSTKGKYPVVLDDGRTTIYISDKSKADETKLKYELLRESRFPSHLIKHHSRTA